MNGAGATTTEGSISIFVTLILLTEGRRAWRGLAQPLPATKNAAAIVKASGEWGTIEPGKLADVIIVDGKPDQTIGDTRRVVTVIKEGDILDRAALRLDHSHIPDYQETGSSMAPVWEAAPEPAKRD